MLGSNSLSFMKCLVTIHLPFINGNEGEIKRLGPPKNKHVELYIKGIMYDEICFLEICHIQ